MLICHAINFEEQKYSWVFLCDRSYQLDQQKCNHDKKVPDTNHEITAYASSLNCIVLIVSFTNKKLQPRKYSLPLLVIQNYPKIKVLSPSNLFQSLPRPMAIQQV